MSAPRLEELRHRLREKFPAAHAVAGFRQVEAEVAHPFDPAVFPPGAISEVIGNGVPCLLARLLAANTAGQAATDAPPEWTLIDGADCFDPASFSSGECARIFWIRCGNAGLALRAADLVVRDPNLPFILLDTCGLPRPELRRLPASSWWRLKLAAEATGCRLVVLSELPQVPCASLRLDLDLKLALADFERPRGELLERLHARFERHRHAT